MMDKCGICMLFDRKCGQNLGDIKSLLLLKCKMLEYHKLLQEIKKKSSWMGLRTSPPPLLFKFERKIENKNSQDVFRMLTSSEF